MPRDATGGILVSVKVLFIIRNNNIYGLGIKVSKGATIRNRYNQVPHLTLLKGHAWARHWGLPSQCY